MDERLPAPVPGRFQLRLLLLLLPPRLLVQRGGCFPSFDFGHSFRPMTHSSLTATEPSDSASPGWGREEPERRAHPPAWVQVAWRGRPVPGAPRGDWFIPGLGRAEFLFSACVREQFGN